MKRFVLLLGALALCGPAAAQIYPVPGKPIRIVIGFAPGGGTDTQVRQVQPKLSEALGTNLVVDYRPGASGMIAATEVAKAPADGYTIYYTFNGVFAQNPFTLPNVPYDPFKDFTPISLGARGSQVLVAHPSIPASNVRELVAWAKQNSAKLSIANFGVGSSSHIFAMLLAQQTGLDLVHVPYKGGGDAANDLYSGRVPLMFDASTTAIPAVAGGKIKFLGVVAEARVPFIPSVPTMTEQGLKGIDLVGWLGWYGPAKLPSAIVQRLNVALVQAHADPKVKEDFGKGAYESVSSTPEQLAAMTRDAYERWGKVIRDLGIKPQ
jgi:tripartite-type tricarboxylate transporter receptor subunit TctC